MRGPVKPASSVRCCLAYLVDIYTLLLSLGKWTFLWPLLSISRFFSPVFSDSLVTLILLKPWNPLSLTFWTLTYVSGSLSKHTPTQSPNSLGTFRNGKFPCFASFLQVPHTLKGEKKCRFPSPFPRLAMLLGHQPYIASLPWLIWHASGFPLPS